MKRFYLFQWIASEKYYVKKTYCGRVVTSSSKVDAKLFNKEGSEKYLLKLQAINPYGEFGIRQLA